MENLENTSVNEAYIMTAEAVKLFIKKDVPRFPIDTLQLLA